MNLYSEQMKLLSKMQQLRKFWKSQNLGRGRLLRLVFPLFKNALGKPKQHIHSEPAQQDAVVAIFDTLKFIKL